MTGNILYGIKDYGAEAMRVTARFIITVIQLLLGTIKILFIISGAVLKMFLAVLLIGKRK